MLTTSTHTQPSLVLQPSSTTPPSVLSQKALPPQEIERICKAFIRLITAKERTNTLAYQPASNKRERRRVSSTSDNAAK